MGSRHGGQRTPSVAPALPLPSHPSQTHRQAHTRTRTHAHSACTPFPHTVQVENANRSLRVRKVLKPCPSCKVRMPCQAFLLFRRRRPAPPPPLRLHRHLQLPPLPHLNWRPTSALHTSTEPPTPPHPTPPPPPLAPQTDICDFLKTAQVNRDMVAVIAKLQAREGRGNRQLSAHAPGWRGQRWLAGKGGRVTGMVCRHCCCQSWLEQPAAIQTHPLAV